MSREKIVNELYKFLREDVTVEKLFEADAIAYPVEEGKLPADPSLIKTPEKDIQLLSEEEKSKIAPAAVTDEPAETEVEEEMEEETPEVEELTQDEETGEAPEVKAADAKVKDEKKIEPKVTSVKKEKAENEGKLPADPSLIIHPDKDIQTLAEETVLTTVSDEIVAKDISSKYPNSRIVVDMLQVKSNSLSW